MLFSDPLANVAFILLSTLFFAFFLFLRKGYIDSKRSIPTDKNDQIFNIKEHSKKDNNTNQIKTHWTLHYLVKYKNSSKMVQYRVLDEDSCGYSGTFNKLFSSKNEAELKAKELSSLAISLSGNQQETLVII